MFFVLDMKNFLCIQNLLLLVNLRFLKIWVLQALDENKKENFYGIFLKSKMYFVEVGGSLKLSLNNLQPTTCNL